MKDHLKFYSLVVRVACAKMGIPAPVLFLQVNTDSDAESVKFPIPQSVQDFWASRTKSALAKIYNTDSKTVMKWAENFDLKFFSGVCYPELNDELKIFCSSHTLKQIKEFTGFEGLLANLRTYLIENQVNFESKFSSGGCYPELNDELKIFCSSHTLKQIKEFTRFKGLLADLRTYLIENQVNFLGSRLPKRVPKFPTVITEDVRAFFSSHTSQELASFYDAYGSYISFFCRLHGLKPKRKERKLESLVIDEDLKKHFLNHTKKELAESYKVSFHLFCSFCKKHGLHTLGEKKQGKRPPKKVESIQMTDEIRAFCNSHTRQEIAERFNFSLCSVGNLCKKYDLKPIKSLKHKKRLPIPTDEIKTFCSQHTRNELADFYGVSYSTLRGWADRHSINTK